MHVSKVIAKKCKNQCILNNSIEIIRCVCFFNFLGRQEYGCTSGIPDRFRNDNFGGSCAKICAIKMTTCTSVTPIDTGIKGSSWAVKTVKK